MTPGFKYVCLKAGCKWSNLFETPAIQHSLQGHGHVTTQVYRDDERNGNSDE